MPHRLDLVFAGFAGSIILGLTGALLWGEPAGIIATIAGLFAGIGGYGAKPYVLDKVHPFSCPSCGSSDSQIIEEELATQDLPRPATRLDMPNYPKLLKQVLIRQTTRQKLRKCGQCGHLQTIKRYTADTNMLLTWYEQ